MSMSTKRLKFDDVDSKVGNLFPSIFEGDAHVHISNIKVRGEVGSAPRHKAVDNFFAYNNVGCLFGLTRAPSIFPPLV